MMQIEITQKNMISLETLEDWMQGQMITLSALRQIDVARVHLCWSINESPAFKVEIHLVTPGPDFHSMGCDHTIVAAFTKAFDAIENKILHATQGRKKNARNKLIFRVRSPAVSRSELMR